MYITVVTIIACTYVASCIALLVLICIQYASSPSVHVDDGTCHNLACRQHGATDAYLQLHAHTHQAMRYYVQHKFGVSHNYNTFTQHPWHGAGQGAADVAMRYIVLSNTLMDAYHMKIVPRMLTDPTRNLEIIRSLKAFINDVVLHTTSSQHDTIDDLQQHAQAQLKWWTQLIQVTGDKLNPKKCCGIIYQWEPDK